jgi:rare lipoprotein A
LSLTKYLLISLTGLLLVSGCASREMDYTYNNYQRNSTTSHSNTRSYRYVHPKNEVVRDSVAMHRATMRSYEVAGITYQPHLVNSGEIYRGIASWYGPNFHAKLTSNGETYNMYAFTAAHKTFPMNTMVKVTNLENNKSVIVRINDRGPFVDGRIIDLSNVAAHQIDMVKKGTAQVKVEVLSLSANIRKIGASQPTQVATGTTPQLQNYDIFVQLGAFSKKEGAEDIKNGFISEKYEPLIHPTEVEGRTIYKVLLANFESEEEARAFIDNSGIGGLHIVRRTR